MYFQNETLILKKIQKQKMVNGKFSVDVSTLSITTMPLINVYWEVVSVDSLNGVILQSAYQMTACYLSVRWLL